MLLGITGITLFSNCMLAALEVGSPGRTSLYQSLSPLLIAVFSVLFLKERFSLKQYSGLIIAFLGVIILMSKGDPLALFTQGQNALTIGEYYMIIGILFWSFYTIFSRIVLAQMMPLMVVTYACLWGTLFCFIGMVLWGDQHISFEMTPRIVSALIYMSLFATRALLCLDV